MKPKYSWGTPLKTATFPAADGTQIKLVTLRISQCIYPTAYFRPRSTWNELLFQDIKKYRMRVPIIVVRCRKGYMILDGVRRVKCLKKLNRRTVRAFIITDKDMSNALNIPGSP